MFCQIVQKNVIGTTWQRYVKKNFIVCRFILCKKIYILSAIVVVKMQFEISGQIWPVHFFGLKKFQKYAHWGNQ